MTAQPKSAPALDELMVGRRYRSRPGARAVEAFLIHLRETGKPHTWKDLTTTAPPSDEVPTLLRRFSIPDRFRRGPASRAPCAICQPRYPKFERGYLVWSPTDGLVRIIGNECGHDHFEGSAYQDALDTLTAEEAEEEARVYLEIALPTLARRLWEAATIRRDLIQLLDFRAAVVATITNKTAQVMLRGRRGDQLTIEVQSHHRDSQGRLLVETLGVVRVAGLDVLRADVSLEMLSHAIRWSAAFLVNPPGDVDWWLSKRTRTEVIEAERSLRLLDVELAEARRLRDQLGALLSADNLLRLAVWGRHLHCPSPFWVEPAGADALFIGRGLRPRTMGGQRRLRAPKAEVFEALTLG